MYVFLPILLYTQNQIRWVDYRPKSEKQGKKLF